MRDSTRTILIIIGVVLIIACLCIASIALVSTYLFVRPASTSTSSNEVIQPSTQVIDVIPTEPSPTEGLPQPTQKGSATSSPLPSVSAPTQAQELPADIAKQMDAIQNEVSKLRGLSANKPVTRALLTPDQLRKKVEDDFLKDYSEEEVRNDTVVLSTFGLIAPDFDLLNFYMDLLSEQIAGYYDDTTKEMYVVQGEGFQGPERLTYAHEFVHVLQDQNYDIENGLGMNDEACEQDSERCAAVQSLLEGDASSVEYEWLGNYGTRQDIKDIQNFYSDYQSPIYDSAPAYLKEDFLFPYEYGQQFVEYLKVHGGDESIDKAYQDLPVSTEQILHPELYPDNKPIAVELTDISNSLGEGWTEIDRGVMGEWYTYLILALGLDANARVQEGEARDAAEGWSGDAYSVYFNEKTGEVVAVLTTQWDSNREAKQFQQAFQDYANERFGQPDLKSSDRIAWNADSDSNYFFIDGANTTWIIAPNGDNAEQVWSMIKPSDN